MWKSDEEYYEGNKTKAYNGERDGDFWMAAIEWAAKKFSQGTWSCNTSRGPPCEDWVGEHLGRGTT